LKLLFLSNSGFDWIIRHETDLCLLAVAGHSRLGDFFEDGREFPDDRKRTGRHRLIFLFNSAIQADIGLITVASKE
jgi:hypothetical protein